jgi:hypothetical protein
MQTDFHINAQKVDVSIIDAIKSIFGERNIKITVQDDFENVEKISNSNINDVMKFAGTVDDESSKEIQDLVKKEFSRIDGDWS